MTRSDNDGVDIDGTSVATVSSSQETARCGACCVAPDISSAGKEAGIPCPHLAEDTTGAKSTIDDVLWCVDNIGQTRFVWKSRRPP